MNYTIDNREVKGYEKIFRTTLKSGIIMIHQSPKAKILNQIMVILLKITIFCHVSYYEKLKLILLRIKSIIRRIINQAFF